MPYHVFVLGLDELNRETLESLPRAQDYCIHGLLTIEELQQRDEIDIPALLDKAATQLEEFEGPIDAVVGYWDFPVSSMVPILADRFGLAAAPLQAVVACEHKYWARLVQQRVVSELPRFAAVDPFDDESVAAIDLDVPYWLKPVKAFSSDMAHRIDDHDDLAAALADIREGIDRLADPFEFVLERVEPPPEVAELGAHMCIAEEAASGRQLTVEGFVDSGDPVVYGLVDSVPCADVPSFERFQYPSTLPAATQQRAADISARVVAALGLRCSTFNVELFWERDRDELKVLEVNPRHSQSHAKLFDYVDGLANHELMIELPIGREPELPRGKGSYAMAAKWFLRRIDDALVTRSPSRADVEEAERRVPGATVHLIAEEGQQLSQLHDQDSYSFKYADVYVGGDTEAELSDKARRCADLLPYEFADVG